MGGEAAETASSLSEAWQAVEQNAHKPLVVFFDQMEEVYTHPNPLDANELEEFGTELKLCWEGNNRPRGRMVLSFRKEWFPEIQKQMEINGLEYGKVFLEGLDREAVMEVVTGLTQTERLRQFYGLRIEPQLPEVIATDLVAD